MRAEIDAAFSFTTIMANSIIYVRWKDSVYKFMWKDLLLYYVLYVSLTLIHEYALNEQWKR